MSDKILFSEEVVSRFDRIGTKLYNFKHSLEFFLNCLGDESDDRLGLICLGYLFKDYYNNLKDEYNKLENDLELI